MRSGEGTGGSWGEGMVMWTGSLEVERSPEAFVVAAVGETSLKMPMTESPGARSLLAVKVSSSESRYGDVGGGVVPLLGPDEPEFLRAERARTSEEAEGRRISGVGSVLSSTSRSKAPAIQSPISEMTTLISGMNEAICRKPDEG